MIKRVSSISVLLALVLSTFALPAVADEAPMARTTYAFFNVNSQEYTAGEKIDGVDMTWATGSGSTRKYIRAKRVADLLKNEVRASLVAVTECDTQMGADLAKLMGSNWRFVGGERSAHNKNGWLYDSSKWSTGNLSVTILPGSQGRRLLQMGFYRRNVPGPNPMLSLAVTHYSSGDPASRDAQAAAVMAKIGGAARMLAADTNALSFPNGRYDDGTTTAPRWVMERLGWEDFGYGVPSFHDYGKIDPGMAIDTIALSPKAQDTDVIDVLWNGSVDTRGKYVSDHMVITVGVEFRTP
jgi:hypothetical protein